MNIKKIIFITLLYLGLYQNLFSHIPVHLNNCNIETIDGCFFYKKSPAIIAMDDMILTEQSIILSSDCIIPDYSKGLFLTDAYMLTTKDIFICDGKDEILLTIDDSQNRIKRKIEAIKNLKVNDEKIGDYIYTKLDLIIEYISLGNFFMNFRENDDIVEKNVPIYIIINMEIK